MTDASADLSSLRVLVAHDWLVSWAGSERVLEEIVRLVPHADVVVAVRSEHLKIDNEVTRRARETWVGRIPFARSHHRWFLPLHYAAFAQLDATGYDLVISSSHAFAKAVRAPAHTPHVCYCHSPPRYLWDMGPTYREHSNSLASAALRLSTPILRDLDCRSARGVTHFVSNSRFVADRIHNTYGRTAEVVYPPVKAKAAWTSQRREPFLLSLGRLVPYKRVDLAIRAAEMLQIKLVVAGEGPDRSRLERIAGSYTEFVGEVSEGDAAHLLSSCCALVFCAEEDFGITPVEANAHGAPVIGYARGGLLETMRKDVTAAFFEHQQPRAVAGAIERSLQMKWDPMTLRQNAARFSPERFRDGMWRVLTSAHESMQRPAAGSISHA